MLWIILGGFVVLLGLLALAFAFESYLDRPSSILAAIAGGLLATALLFYSLTQAMRFPDMSDDVLATFTTLSGICGSAAWFFIFVAMIRLAGGQRVTLPGMGGVHRRGRDGAQGGGGERRAVEPETRYSHLSSTAPAAYREHAYQPTSSERDSSYREREYRGEQGYGERQMGDEHERYEQRAQRPWSEPERPVHQDPLADQPVQTPAQEPSRDRPAGTEQLS